MKLTALFVSAFVAASLGMPLEHVQHEMRSASSSVVKLAAAQTSTTVPVRINLKQQNLERGMDLLMAVSDPDSPQYGQHWTRQQVIDQFAPAQESIDTVKQWLVDAGIPADDLTVAKDKGSIGFKTSVGTLEALLKTSYHVYENQKTASQHLGSDGYSLPAEVAQHVDFVWPGVVTSQIRAGARPLKANSPLSAAVLRETRQDPLADCASRVTPECIAAMYKIPAAPTKTDPTNRLGMLEIGDQFFTQSDLDLFYKNAAKSIPEGTGPKIDYVNFNGSRPDPSNAADEANMDFEMAYPIIYPQTTELYQVNGDFNNFLDGIDGDYCDSDSNAGECAGLSPANVISVSYGGTEPPESVARVKVSTKNYPSGFDVPDGAIEEETLTYIASPQRDCDEYMKLGLQGTTVVFSSGDLGVRGNGDCSGTNYNIFTPGFPVGCPYVLAVGATKLPEGGKPGDAERVVERFAPGGGFSNVYGVADYQKSAVQAFFDNHDPGFPSYNTTDGTFPQNGPGLYNRIGRGYPDVSAVGDYGVIGSKGKMSTDGDGTSMSAPILAAILTRINEERLAAGKKPVGFVNPAFYKNPSMFHDVTVGRMGTDDSFSCDGKSFSAAEGWDPVTGLGTPDYPAMSKYFASLQ